MYLVTIATKSLQNAIPLIKELKHQITHHYILYDTNDANYAQILYEGLQKLHYPFASTLLPLDEDNKQSFQNLFAKLPAKNLFLNLHNDIDPNVALQLSNFVLSHNGRVLTYDKQENSYNILPDMQNKTITNNLTIKEYCTLLGLELRYKTPTLYTKNLTEKIFQNFTLLKKALANPKASPRYEQLHRLIKAHPSSHKNPKSALGEIFEEFIYWKLFSLDVDDIVLSATIQKEDVANEFDILMIKNNTMYVVECKYKNSLAKYQESLPIIYKMDALLDIFGCDTKGLVVHIGNTKSEEQEGFDISSEFKLNAHKRALQGNIFIYHKHYFDPQSFYKKTAKMGLLRRAFLLGGCDLEMATIKKILSRYNQKFFNKNLSWGAKLSSYKNHFNEPFAFYGIELIEDVPPPPNYHTIDHHNELLNNPSSIEQMCEILGIKLSRFYKAVSLNDAGYIPALKEGGFEHHIQSIRRLDRAAQGVQREDEEALFEIKNLKNLVVVYTKTTRFSPIVDKLYGTYSNLLVYNDNEFTFYGDENVVEKFKDKALYYSKNFFGGNDIKLIESILQLFTP